MKAKNDTTLIIAILIPISTGVLSAFFGGNMSIYSTLAKPALAPPAILFPIVWIILYTLMGLSSCIIYESSGACRKKALEIYIIQLAVNFVWSILFFRFSLYLIAFIWLLALIGLIGLMIYYFYLTSKPAAYIQIPYLLWCLFAAYLNFMIFLKN